MGAAPAYQADLLALVYEGRVFKAEDLDAAGRLSSFQLCVNVQVAGDTYVIRGLDSRFTRDHLRALMVALIEHARDSVVGEMTNIMWERRRADGTRAVKRFELARVAAILEIPYPPPTKSGGRGAATPRAAR